MLKKFFLITFFSILTEKSLFADFFSVCGIKENELRNIEYVLKNSSNRFIPREIDDIKNETFKRALYLLSFYKEGAAFPEEFIDIVGIKDVKKIRRFKEYVINYILKTNKPLILSTGMATLDEIKETYNFIKNKDNLTILHCITGYPTSFKEANLNFIKTLQKEFDVPIGFSDHSPGIELPIAAVALGACVVEKHFTLDKNLEGPDHKASLNPKEFKAMVDAIRNVEVAMGDGVRKFSENEKEIKKVARKSIVLNNDVKKGTILKREMLSIKRPGTGISPKNIDEIIGKTVIKDLNSGHILKWDDIE